MANTTKKQNNLKNIIKILVAVFVLAVLWIFVNDSTYNIVKKPFVESSDKYTEMYAYSKTKPVTSKKYFIVQDNDVAKSFFMGEVEVVSEGDLGSIDCSKEEVFLIYEKPSGTIDVFVEKQGGEALVLNSGTDIEFYVIKIKNGQASCNIGGQDE